MSTRQRGVAVIFDHEKATARLYGVTVCVVCGITMYGLEVREPRKGDQHPAPTLKSVYDNSKQQLHKLLKHNWLQFPLL